MAIARLESGRLTLEPLRVEHADELAPVLDDPKLHEFIGGRPASAGELRAQFARQTAGSPDPSERWLNWVMRLRATGEAVGTAQATVRGEDPGASADLAWVIGTAYQGQGLAKEAAGLVAGWLRGEGVQRLGARIHPDHQASNRVARSIGLTPTTTIVDGEIQWQSQQRSPMEFEQITTDLTDQVLTITLNRPDRLNAWTQTMFTELMTAFDHADADDEVRAVIVTGAGRGFCAGADLERGGETFTKRDHEDPDTIPRDSGGRLTLRIFDMTKPVIAAINGPAVGIGATMTLPMDVRLAAEDARIGFVFVRRGIVPEACSSWFLPRVVGISRAMEWVATGRVFDAREALEGGLVRSLHPKAELLDAANALAHEIAANAAPVSVALARRMLWRMLGAEHPMQAHRTDSRGMLYRGRSADAAEGIAAFLEKRAAVFPDRVSAGLPDIMPGWTGPEFR
ncbi:MAG TPA: GNAT family N-acetyltransferase [Solirubrobacteraceae bacterium]|nr:GNAT family N-acetyltransferase [Solirubrobacteraceae bacterium]